MHSLLSLRGWSEPREVHLVTRAWGHVVTGDLGAAGESVFDGTELPQGKGRGRHMQGLPLSSVRVLDAAEPHR